MKKIILTLSFLLVSLQGEEIRVTPSLYSILYDDALENSLKKSTDISKIDFLISDSAYSVEVDYGYKNVKYKDLSLLTDYIQHDFTLKYSNYFDNKIATLGVHVIKNNEQYIYRDLGSGIVGILSLSSYNNFERDKLLYGLDAYYSLYFNAHDDKYISATQLIDVIQFSPFIKYKNVFSSTTRNDVSFKLNMIAATQYSDQAYLSLEFSDTFVYRGFYTTLSFTGGEMRSGVTDGGNIVYNNKDMLNSTYEVEMGYYFTKSFVLNASYSLNDYKEYNPQTLQLLPSSYNSVSMVSLSCSF